MKIYWNRDWNNNRLENRLFQSVGVNPWHVESKFFYNTTNDRLNIWVWVGYEEVAYLSDLVGFSKRKYNIDAATVAPILLTWEQTIDDVVLVAWDRVLVKDQADPTTNGYYTVSAGARTRITEANTASEVEDSQTIVEWGTTNGWTIWKNQNGDGTITERTTPIVFAQLSITVPTEDKFVKVSVTDTTEKYLSEAINNTIVIAWPAIDNQDAIQLIHVNIWWDEDLSFGLDLSDYTWDVKITWGLEVTGLSQLWDTSFASGSTIDYNDVTQNYTGDNITNLANWATMTNNLDGDVSNNYGANYTENNDYTAWATINNTWDLAVNNTDLTTTTVNDNVINEVSGDVTNNYDATYEENNNYTAGATINNTGDIINNNTDLNTTTNNTNVTETNNSIFTPIGCSGAIANTNTVAIDPTATKFEINLVYDNTGIDPLDTRTKDVVITPDSTILTVVESWKTGTITVEIIATDIVVTQTDWAWTSTSDVCQFSGGITINDNGSITNNTNNVTNNTDTNVNNTWVVENYDSTSNITNLWNTYLENLVVNNITNIDWTPFVTVAPFYEEHVAIALQTVINLTASPSSPFSIYVSSDSWLFLKQWLTRDYVVSWVNNNVLTFNTALLVWDVITVQWF